MYNNFLGVLGGHHHIKLQTLFKTQDLFQSYFIHRSTWLGIKDNHYISAEMLIVAETDNLSYSFLKKKMAISLLVAKLLLDILQLFIGYWMCFNKTFQELLTICLGHWVAIII
jgi:hypothetical protein